MTRLCIGGNQVLVPEGEAKDLLEASAADTVEVGPFQVQLKPRSTCQPLHALPPLSFWL